MDHTETNIEQNLVKVQKWLGSVAVSVELFDALIFHCGDKFNSDMRLTRKLIWW